MYESRKYSYYDSYARSSILSTHVPILPAISVVLRPLHCVLLLVRTGRGCCDRTADTNVCVNVICHTCPPPHPPRVRPRPDRVGGVAVVRAGTPRWAYLGTDVDVSDPPRSPSLPVLRRVPGEEGGTVGMGQLVGGPRLLGRCRCRLRRRRTGRRSGPAASSSSYLRRGASHGDGAGGSVRGRRRVRGYLVVRGYMYVLCRMCVWGDGEDYLPVTLCFAAAAFPPVLWWHMSRSARGTGTHCVPWLSNMQEYPFGVVYESYISFLHNIRNIHTSS